MSIDARWRPALELAVNAPSVHNMQPWRFLARADGGLELRMADGALAGDRDASLRTVTISCGVVLHHLRVALRAAGETPLVELSPDPGAVGLLAIVRLGEPRPPTWEEEVHAHAITARHTQRTPFDGRPLRGELLDRLSLVAADEGGFLDVLRDERREAACELLDGDARALALDSPALAALSASGDGLRDQLETGQALSAVLLEGAAEGCAVGFLDTPLRDAAARAQLRDLLTRREVPMLLLRVGHADPVPRQERRSVDAVLGIAAAP